MSDQSLPKPNHEIAKDINRKLRTTNLTINQLECIAIEAELERTNGNITEAAKNLGIGRATLYRKISQYNIKK